MRFVSGLATVPVLFPAAMGAESPALAATFDVVDVAGLSAARLHWGIENGFHRCPDFAFREAAAIRSRSAPQVVFSSHPLF